MSCTCWRAQPESGAHHPDVRHDRPDRDHLRRVRPARRLLPPGDSLLFTAGLLASQGRLNLAVVLIGCFLAAFIGDQVGYAFGKKVGPSIFKRPDSRWFKHENVERAEEFFEHHGSKTIVLARFVPVVRTFAPIVAGVSSMRYRTFVAYNVIGAFLWAVGVTLLGYWLGETVPNIDKYLLPIILGIIVLSLIPVCGRVPSAEEQGGEALARG